MMTFMTPPVLGCVVVVEGLVVVVWAEVVEGGADVVVVTAGELVVGDADEQPLQTSMSASINTSETKIDFRIMVTSYFVVLEYFKRHSLTLFY
jgi:hypothetical protein